MSNPYEAPRGPLGAGPTADGKGKATASLVLGLLGLVGWCIPPIGLVMTITGLVLGIKGLGPSQRGTAVAGIALSTLGLMLSVVNMGLGAYLGATGQHPLFQAPPAARATAP